MGGVAAFSFSHVITGAAEILNIRVALVKMEVHISAAVRTDQDTGKHILLSVRCLGLSHLASLFLDSLKGLPFDNRFVHIEEDHPIFRSVAVTFLIFIGLGIGLEIDDVAAILLRRKDFAYG